MPQLQLYLINNIRRSASWLEHNCLKPDVPGIYPLADNPPPFNQFTERLIDGGTAGNPESGYYIDWFVEPLSEEEILNNLPAIKEARLTEILTAANAMSASIKAKYSQPEIDSWQQQEVEARALLEDEDVAAPLVCDLAANAGVTSLEFAQRIISNADAAAAATKAIILQQQAMEKAVKEAESVEAVQTVKVEYQLF